MQEVADFLDSSVFPRGAIEAIRSIEAEAKNPKSNVTGFKIKFDSGNSRLVIEKTIRPLVWKGQAKTSE